MAGLLGAGLLKTGASPDTTGISKQSLSPLSPFTGSVSVSTPSSYVAPGTPDLTGGVLDILRAFPRAGAALVQTGKQLVTGQPEDFDPTQSPVSTIASTVFGKEPVQSLQDQGIATQAKYPSVPAPLIALGVSAGEVFNLIPAGGESSAISKIAASTDVAGIANILRTIGVSEDLVGPAAQKFATLSDKTAVKAGLDSLAELQKSTKTTGLLGAAEQSGRTLQDLSEGSPLRAPTAAPALPPISSLVDDLPKVSNLANTALNVERLAISPESKATIARIVEEVKPAINKAIGGTLSNAEAIKFAAQSSEVLTRTVGRDSTLAWQASMLKARQVLGAATESGTVNREYIDTLLAIKTQGTDIARKLQSLSIAADPVRNTAKGAIIDAILKTTDNVDAILKAAQGVDFTDLRQATEFYRKFVAPQAREWIDLIRYNSMLSSPKTHIINVFSNLLNTALVAPIEKTLTGGLDFLGSKITGNARGAFAGEGGVYLKNYFANVRNATQRLGQVMSGTKSYTNLDTRGIPIATSGVKGAVVKALSYPTRLLEGMDQFFTALAEGGQQGALQYRAGKGAQVGNVESEAAKDAAYRLYRQGLHQEGQGHILDAIDVMTSKLQSLRTAKNPIVSTVAKFTVPFLQTPMNIFKQGVEYSPLGLTTLSGAANKTEQLSKAIMGSAVFGGAAMLALSNRLTFAEPTDPTRKQAFRAAGMQPYSVKIGNKWVSFQKLPPVLAFPMAMTAAIHDTMENKQIDDNTVDLILTSVAKYGTFLSDQSYAKSIGDILNAASGGESGIERVISNDAQQLIPYRALGGWLAHLTDPTQRKIDSSASFVDQQVQLLMENIPGLSEKVPARLDSSGNPIPQAHPILNAFSPIAVSDETAQSKDYQNLVNISQINKQSTANSQDLTDEANKEINTIKTLSTDDAKKAYLKDLATKNPDLATRVIALAKGNAQGLSSTDTRLLGSSVATRAQYIANEMQGLDVASQKALLKDYASKKILTADTLTALSKLIKKP